MSVHGLLRILILDDAPTVVDPETKCPSFAAGCGPGDRAILERNFQLSWIYTREQMKEYYYRLQLSLACSPRELLSVTHYPNIVLFDYSLERTQLTDTGLARSKTATRAFARMNPLVGDWGRHSEVLGLTKADFRERLKWTRTYSLDPNRPDRDDLNFDGCFAGGLITQVLREYASVGVPQTVHRDHEKTDFFEWMLDIELKDAFAYKTGQLERWFVFLAKALPRLRQQIIQSAYRGTLTPKLSDILAASAAREWTMAQDLSIAFSSTLGGEHFRLEALFLDQCYQLSMASGRLECIWSERTSEIVGQWCTDVMEACLKRKGELDELREGVRWADIFISAFASPTYEERRLLSRSLRDTKGSEDRASRAIKTHEFLLERLGVTHEQIIEAVRDGNVHLLEIPEQSQERILGPLPTYAQASTRIAVLALVVWAEMSVCGLSDASIRARVQRLADLLRSGEEWGQEFLDQLAELEGLLVPIGISNELRTFGQSSTSPHGKDELEKLIRKHLGRLEVVAGFDHLLAEPEGDDGADGMGWQRVAGSEQELIRLIHDVLAPAPRKLLLGRDRPEKRGDAAIPLKRLVGGSISIADIVEGRIRPNGNGLDKGEGRLLSLFAAQFGFEQRYWRPWFRKAVSV